MQSAPPVFFNFETTCDALVDAVVRGSYEGIDKIIRDDLNSLTQVSDTKTPLFSAVEKILRNNNNLDENEARRALNDSIVSALAHIFHEVDIRMAFDKEKTDAFINKACNQHAQTDLLPWPATLRDLLEEHASVDFKKPSYEKTHRELHHLVETYGLMLGEGNDWVRDTVRNRSSKGQATSGDIAL